MVSRDDPRKKVLIVDQSSESREVLVTVLQRRGIDTLEAEGGAAGLEIANACDPDLVVLDLDSVDGSHHLVYDGFQARAREAHSSLVLLGSFRQWRSSTTSADVVAKPYHYGPLVRKIQELMDRGDSTPQPKDMSPDTAHEPR